MSKSAIRAGDRAFAKVGRNLVEVRVIERTDGGWRVTSRTGKPLTVKTLLSANGEPLAATETPAIAPTAAPSPRAVPPKGLSLVCAAAAVLERANAPLSVKAMIDAAKAQGIWTPRTGKTPEQTLYSAIIREIRDKGTSSRFRKEGRGLFSFVRDPHAS